MFSRIILLHRDLLQVIYEDKDADKPELLQYVQELKDIGNKVELVRYSDN